MPLSPPTQRRRLDGPAPLNVIVWGETGDGKSTLINKLCGGNVAETGKKPSGVTKNVRRHRAVLQVGAAQPLVVDLWDLPGAGDKDVPAYRTLSMLGVAFEKFPVDGVLLLSSRPDRMPLGAQLVAKLMDMSFAQNDKWSSIALVGTKNDKYDPDDDENFRRDVLAEFNRTTSGNITKVCTINQNDIKPVVEVLKLLGQERGLGKYKQPDAAAVATTVCDLNGLPPGAERDEMMKTLMQQIESDRKQLREELARIREEQKEAQKRHDAQVEKMDARNAEMMQQHRDDLGQMRSDHNQNMAMLAHRLENMDQGGGCFPGDSVATTTDGPKRLDALRIGDVVQTDLSGKMEQVIGFYDYDPSTLCDFIDITFVAGGDGTERTRSVSLTGNHLIYAIPAGGNDGPTHCQAAKVGAGARLFSVSGGPVEICGTSTRRGEGVFSPATPSGRIVIDGVLCSAYAKPRRFADVAVTDETAHRLLHLGALPMRWAWRLRAAVPEWIASAPQPQVRKGSHWATEVAKCAWTPLLRLASIHH